MARKSGYHLDIEPTISKRESMRDSMRSSSVASSSVISDVSISKRSTVPKILGVIIAALAVVAIVVGVTYYLMDLEKEKREEARPAKSASEVFAQEPEAINMADDEKPNRKQEEGTSRPETSYSQDKITRAKLLEIAKQRLMLLRDAQSMFYNRNEEQSFLRPTKEEASLISSLISGRHPLMVDTQNIEKKEQEQSLAATATVQPQQEESTGKVEDLEFGGVGLFGRRGESQEKMVIEDIQEQEDRDSSSDLTTIGEYTYDDYSEASTTKSPYSAYRDIYDMANYRQYNRKPLRQRILRPGLEGRHRGIENFPPRMEESVVEELDSLAESEADNIFSESERDYVAMLDTMESMPKNIITSDGSIRPVLPLSRTIHQNTKLQTLDRRPNRPAFHHQGPLGGPIAAQQEVPDSFVQYDMADRGTLFDQQQYDELTVAEERISRRGKLGRKIRPYMRRRFKGPPSSMKYQQDLATAMKMNEDANLEEKFDEENIRTASESAQTVDIKHDEILSNFDNFLKLAGTELLTVRDVALNITASGKDMNLWEIISAVNDTVRKSPESNMAKLITKFEEKYLTSDPTVSSIQPADVVYERSLSSLLFLSMGIFLLNSVNELVDNNFVPEETGRSLQATAPVRIQDLVTSNAKLDNILQLFNATEFDIFSHENGDQASEVEGSDGTPANSLNNYVRLVMNLMNSYTKENEEFECIYSTYCAELNKQAELGGMLGSVARINSVGLRLALKELENEDILPVLLNNLWSWKDLPCDVMFPHCTAS